MDAAKLQRIVDEVHGATAIATEIIEAAGIGGNFNEELVERGEDAAFAIVKAAITGYTNATGKTLTPEDVTALLITEAPLVADAEPEPEPEKLTTGTDAGTEGAQGVGESGTESGSQEPKPEGSEPSQ